MSNLIVGTSCTLSGLSVREVAPWTVKPILAMVAVLLLITLFPAAITALPRYLGLM